MNIKICIFCLSGLLLLFGSKFVHSQYVPNYFERPENDQLYPRNCNNEAEVGIDFEVNIPSTSQADELCLQVFQNPQSGTEILYSEECLTLTPYLAYTIRQLFASTIHAGLFEYRYQLVWKKTGNVLSTNNIANSVVAGDVYIIQGQSWAVADPQLPAARHIANESPYSKSFGDNHCNSNPTWGKSHANPALSSPAKNNHFVGVWGLKLQKELQDRYQMPTCFFNGAVGGTSVAHHLPNASHLNNRLNCTKNIFDMLHYRVDLAGLTQHIKGIFWWEGWDGNTIPTQFFVEFDQLYQGWQLVFPDYAKTYYVQTTMCCTPPTIVPEMRNELRKMASLYPYLEVVSDHALEADQYTFPRYDGCHYEFEANEIFALRMSDLLGRDFYCDNSGIEVSSPNIQRAYYKDNPPNNLLVLEFDQAMGDPSNLETYFEFDVGGIVGALGPSNVNGNNIELPVSSNNITKVSYMSNNKLMENVPQYLHAGIPSCNQHSYNTPFNIFWLKNSNGVPALSFHDIIVGAPPTLGSIGYWQNVQNGYNLNTGYLSRSEPCGLLTSGVVSNHVIITPVGSCNSSIVANGKNVEFKAALKVDLHNGFEANQGSYFRAYIDNSTYTDKNPKSNCCSGTGTRLPRSNVEIQKADISKIIVIPNPNNGSFKIQGIPAGPVDISILNINGKRILNIDNSSNRTFNFSHLESGTYVVIIRQYGVSFNSKLIIN